MKRLSTLKITNLPYAAGKLNFSIIIDKITKRPINVLTGYLLSYAINNPDPIGNTSSTYANALKVFFEEIVYFNDIDWKDIKDEDMGAYLFGHLLKNKGLSGKTIKLKIAALKSFYEWAYSTGLLEYPLDFNYAYEYPGFREHLHIGDAKKSLASLYIKKKEFLKILENIPSSSTYINQRDEIVMLLGYYSGFRAHETTSEHNLEINEIIRLLEKAQENNEFSIEVTIYGKGNYKARKVLLPPEVTTKIQEFIKKRKQKKHGGLTGPLIASEKGKILNHKHASRIFRESILNCLNCIEQKWMNYSYHSLRHTYATNLVTFCHENSMDWQAILPARLGHNDLSTSLIYVEFEALMFNRLNILEKLNVLKKYGPIRG